SVGMLVGVEEWEYNLLKRAEWCLRIHPLTAPVFELEAEIPLNTLKGARALGVRAGERSMAGAPSLQGMQSAEGMASAVAVESWGARGVVDGDLLAQLAHLRLAELEAVLGDDLKPEEIIEVVGLTRRCMRTPTHYV
ncbi:hypothetical protein CYMTET_39040, partial [Cymbomonas tetramitiformis]